MSRVNSAIRPSPAMVDISTESYTHEGGLWLGCFWFHYPYQKCEGKEECKFSESHSNFRKTNFGKRQFCAKSHRPIKYCNNFRICKKNQHLQQARHISYRQAGQHLRYSVGRVTTKVTPCKERNLCYLLEWTKRHLKPQLDCQWQATWIRLDLNILNPGQRREGTSSLYSLLMSSFTQHQMLCYMI